MERNLNLLFTSVGRRVELIQCFKNAARLANTKMKIWGGDISDTAPALAFCDERIQLYRISDPKYIENLLEICKKENIDVLIPTIDTDLLVLARNKEQFREIGTQVLISDEKMISICRDKRLTADFFVYCGLRTPYPVDAVENYTGGFPCFIKPKDGSSSKDAYRVDSKEELYSLAKRVKDYIIQPFIEGKEYTIDIFCDFEGKPLCITPRERSAVRSGEVLKTQIINDLEMIEEAKRIVDKFHPCGPITVQLIRQKDTQEDYFIEINPRFGGGAPLSIKAGADSAGALIRMLGGEKCAYRQGAARDKAIYSRYDQSVCMSPQTRKEVADFSDIWEECKSHPVVIFDLDDTLYNEKDYVYSGFLAVEKLLCDIPNAADKLWNEFTHGKNAIDAVLQEANLFSEELRQECLQCYRSHEPEISLAPDVQKVLSQMKKAGKKIGIITDGRPEGQWKKIHRLGLEQYVQEVIVTDELAGNASPMTFRKPCAIAFELMQMRMNCSFEDMVYIGDNLTKDFRAPEFLGMHTIWLQNKEGLYYQGKE